MKGVFRTKKINLQHMGDLGLKRCLSSFDLTLLGIGAIIGAGIFVITGIVAANKAGPGIVYSYLLAGFVCALCAFCYAELAASIGGCGSAYNYGYVSFGEIIAWIIGWDLLMEYGVSVSAVAMGWSGYVHNALASLGVNIPSYLLKGPFEGGIVNLPALLIILFLALVLAIGISHSKRFNHLMVVIKLAVIVLFIVIATHHINPVNWHPFLPYGVHGVITGAAVIFFAYIGFDAVSTAAEETVNPQKSLPIGIITSLLIATIIYIILAGCLTGMANYKTLAVSSPVSHVLLALGYHMAAGFVAVGAIAGLTSVLLVTYYGFTRIFFAMAHDGLLPKYFSKIHIRTKTPTRAILIGGTVMALIAGFLPIEKTAEVVNIGTLAAFTIVCIGVIILRYTQPDLHRPFKVPFAPWLPAIGALSCIFLMVHLPLMTWITFAVWMILGLIVYRFYSYKHSELRGK